MYTMIYYKYEMNKPSCQWITAATKLWQYTYKVYSRQRTGCQQMHYACIWSPQLYPIICTSPRALILSITPCSCKNLANPVQPPQ